MLNAARAVAGKDLRLTLSGGGGLVQPLLLGLLLIFVFSLSQAPGQRMSAQGAAAIFWLASAFCQVLIFNTLYAAEEINGQRTALALVPCPIQAVWLGKALCGLLVLLASQALFVPAIVVFLGQAVSDQWPNGLGILIACNLGMAFLGSLLGALSQGQSGKESLLSIILFPLLVPLLLGGIRVGAAVFSGKPDPGTGTWFGLALAFDAIYAAAAMLLFPAVYNAEE